MKIDITASITGINYRPFLCRNLNTYTIDELEKAVSQDSSFILKVNNENEIAFSYWVSAKRTRSYPYARVYDTLKFVGKKVTLIPVIKDEGLDGDRDFIQWDTISLMSLLKIYVIISYYKDAKKNPDYRNKITEQKYNISHVRDQISSLLSYQSDALHWNLSQAERVGELAKKSLQSYDRISERLKISMHSKESAESRVRQLLAKKDAFMTLSRNLAQQAQARERVTVQPNEKSTGIKGTLTIKNHLGGYYFFTADEVELDRKNVYIIERKHTKENRLPSLEDIKDGLLKLILNTNLTNVKVNEQDYNPIPVLKLTTGSNFDLHSPTNKSLIDVIVHEANANRFQLRVNDKVIT
jgi:hypothetical protein